MNVIAVDVGRDFVDLCKWDGRRAITLRRGLEHPEKGWSKWLAEFGSPPRHEAVFRCAHPDWSETCPRELVTRWAGAAGARWVRYLSTRPACDPGLAAARHLAGRTRWTRVRSVEVRGLTACLGSQDRRGRVEQFHVHLLDAPLHRQSNALQECLQVLGPPPETTETSGLICLGDSADHWAEAAARALQTTDLLVPGNPESWPVLGMLLAPIELEFEKSLRHADLSIQQLRAGFVELMDEAMDAVTREGYDLDDTESVRLVRKAAPNGAAPEVEFEKLVSASHTDSGAIIQGIESIRLQVTITPPVPDWPGDVAPPMIK